MSEGERLTSLLGPSHIDAMPTLVIVKAAFDAEAGVWYVETSDLPGLNVEAASMEAFQAKIAVAVEDLLSLTADGSGDEIDVPIEIIAHASARARLRVAAE